MFHLAFSSTAWIGDVLRYLCYTHLVVLSGLTSNHRDIRTGEFSYGNITGWHYELTVCRERNCGRHVLIRCEEDVLSVATLRLR